MFGKFFFLFSAATKNAQSTQLSAAQSELTSDK